MKNNVVYIDPIYIKYRRMWKEDRWALSGELVRLTINLNKKGLDNIEQHQYNTIHRVIEENNGNWTDGYEFNNGELKKL